MKQTQTTRRRSTAYLISTPNLIPRLQLQAKTLLQVGYRVSVIGWDRHGSHPEREHRDGIEFVRVRPWARLKVDGNPGAGPAFTLWGVPSQRGLKMLGKLPELLPGTYLALRKIDPDVVHCCHAALLPLAVLFAKTHGKKVIYEASDFYIRQNFQNAPPMVARLEPVALATEAALVRMVDGVICVPFANDELMRRYSRYNRNVRLVMNVPERDDVVDEELLSELRQRYAGCTVLVYSGYLGKSTGIIQTIKALQNMRREFPNVRLLVVGSTIGDDTALIQRVISEHEMDPVVDIVPFQPYQRLGTYLRVASIGLGLKLKGAASMQKMGSSRKLSDYLKASLAIVGSEQGEAAEVVRGERCGVLADIWSQEKLEDALRTLLGNSQEVKRMRERARAAFLTRYNWDIEKLELLRAYESIWTSGGDAYP